LKPKTCNLDENIQSYGHNRFLEVVGPGAPWCLGSKSPTIKISELPGMLGSCKFGELIGIHDTENQFILKSGIIWTAWLPNLNMFFWVRWRRRCTPSHSTLTKWKPEDVKLIFHFQGSCMPHLILDKKSEIGWELPKF
jgi:hypothetical protein